MSVNIRVALLAAACLLSGCATQPASIASRSSKENTITNACMARNGYLAQ